MNKSIKISWLGKRCLNILGRMTAGRAHGRIALHAQFDEF
jgi:hypothetical protein